MTPKTPRHRFAKGNQLRKKPVEELAVPFSCRLPPGVKAKIKAYANRKDLELCSQSQVITRAMDCLEANYYLP